MLNTPASTYRLQLTPSFTFDDAAARIPYLQALGVTHVFCSPILQAAPGSMHGYDVVDHSRVSDDLGGEEGFRRLAAAASEHGLGLVVDVVPNHMSVPTPMWLNTALWDVMRNGADSQYARWFDMDLSGDQAILMPVLGEKIGKELSSGNIKVETRSVPGLGEQPVVSYFDHVFPVRPGTEGLPIAELLEHQWYRLAHWRVGSEELNYRRFFDVDTLAAVRVEDPAVFDATHAKLLELYREGLFQGFRLDHIDGLANPRAYVARLHEVTDGAWIVAEKILEADEVLPQAFDCAGTTGYDALQRITGLFQESAALPRLNDIWERATESAQGFHAALIEAKHEVVETMLFTEVNRLTSIVVAICDADIRLRDHTRRQIMHAITDTLILARDGDGEPVDVVELSDEEVARIREREEAEIARSMQSNRTPEETAELAASLPKAFDDLNAQLENLLAHADEAKTQISEEPVEVETVTSYSENHMVGVEVANGVAVGVTIRPSWVHGKSGLVITECFTEAIQGLADVSAAQPHQ